MELHPQKVQIRKLRQGIDFLGYVVLPYYTTLRTKTKKRMFKKIKLNKEKIKRGLITEESFNQSLQSYYGILKHCSGFKIRKNIVFLTTEAAITDLPEKNPPVGGPMGGGMGMGM